MKTIGKILAGICAVLFVLTGVAALLLFNIERKVFSSETYKQAFDDQDLSGRLPKVLGNTLHTSIAEDENVDPFLKALTVEDWEASISSLLPPDELKILTDSALDSVFDYVNGKTDSAVISVVSFKNHLAGGSGAEVVKLILRAQSPCTLEQLLQIGLGLVERGDLILCNPPEEAFGLIAPLIDSQQQLITLIFPDQVTLISGEKSGTVDDPRIKLNKVRAVMKITPVLPLMFLIGIVIFAIRSLMDWFKWWGWPFLATGVISFFVALIGSPIFALIIREFVQSRGSGLFPTILISVLGETVDPVSRQILNPVAIEGFLLALLGMGMIRSAAFLMNTGKRLPTSPPPRTAA